MLKNIVFISLILILKTIYSQNNTSIYFASKAESYAINSKNKKAYKFYLKAAKIEKSNADYFVEAANNYYLAYDLSKEKQRKIFINLLNDAFHIKPWYNRAILLRSEFYINNGNFKLAHSDLDSLIKFERKNKEAYTQKIKAYMIQKKNEEAKLTYKNSFEIFDSTNGLLDIISEYTFWCYQKNLFEDCKNAGILYNKFSKSNRYSCYISYSYYNLSKSDSSCYYYKNCILNKYPSLKMKKELREVCKP